MDSEASLVCDLKKMVIDKDTKGIENVLVELSKTENFQSPELKDTFTDLLLINNTPRINLLVAKTIAEITKSPEQRVKFSSNEILEKLLELLTLSITARSTSDDGIDLIIQLCRALGNIFFSNDDARNIIFHLDGGKALVDLFTISISDISNADDLETFTKVRSGVMSNYLLGNEELSQKAIEFGIVEKIKDRMEESSKGVEHLLPLFSILTEQVSDLIFKPDIISLITKTLKGSNPEVVESCLELLLCQAESDEVKFLLAKEGLCEHFFNSVEDFMKILENEDTKHLVKLTCDLIVLILTGDDAMHYLDKTPLLKHIKTWLESSHVDLMTTSILALGNFARTDEHCIRMVEGKMHMKLIEILSKNNGPEADVRLQHALLCTIRNLVIPKQNKVAVMDAGLVDTILPMLETHQPPVVFKLLGTLRMLVDGQSDLALSLLQNEKLLATLVEWARKTPDMIGVNSEASRLMAWLIKNGYRSQTDKEHKIEPLKTFVAVDGTVDVIVKMLDSAHLVMQNEALMALTLITVFLSAQETELSKIFISSDLGAALVSFIQRISEMDRTTNEIVENLNALVKALNNFEAMKTHLSEHNIEEKLKIVPRIKELATL